MTSGIRYFITCLLVAGSTLSASSKGLTDKSIEATLTFATSQSQELYNIILPQQARLPRTVSESGNLVSSNDSWWTSGFFPGTLWYLYEFSQNEEMRQAAIAMTNRVEKQQFTTDNHDVGFIINCSYGNGLRLTGEKKYEQIIVNAAKSLATRFHPVTGTIRSWNSNKWQYAVIIDNMMNLELLCLATRLSGDSTYARIAIAHADNTLKYHFRPDGSSYHVVSYDTIRGGYAERVTHQGAHNESAWARGQAWGLYGFTMMYRETRKPEYLHQARKIADFLINHPNLPADGIPYWDFNAPKIPDEPRDASAAAVIASALIELSTMTTGKESKQYLAAAEKMLVSLSSPAYLAKKNENGNFILKNSVGFMAKNSEVNAPLTYADYYFVEALLRYRKLNQPDSVKATDKFREHPRLFFLKDEEVTLKKKITTDKRLQGVHELIIAESRRMISLPLLTRNQVGRRILHTSREAIRRITFLAYAHRMTGEKGFAERAKAEMFNVAAFENWNPTHFLDVAEMTMAVAIGYDWLFDKLSKEERTRIEKAIQVLGIEPSTETRYNKWLKNTNNWNQVCNGGISAGAVATFENNKSANAALLNRAISSVPLGMHEYSDHGGYPEGYHYWDYGTSYNLLLLDMLTQNAGTDAGLKAQRGFLETGIFMQQLEGNILKTGKKQIAYPLCFNYADCSEETSVNPAMFWFASETGNASLLYRELQKLETDLQFRPEKLTVNRFLPMLLLWSRKVDFSQVTVPERKMYVANGKTEIAVMRSSWTDSTAIYVGVKAGTPSASHQHMDVGSFIMEANGVRWAMDFGLQEYNSLETRGVDLWNRNQNSQRWDVFRYRNSSHNTLTNNNNRQLVAGNATVEKLSDIPEKMAVRMDLTSLYAGDMRKLTRTVSLCNGQFVQIDDQLNNADKPASVRWNLLTKATPKIINDSTIVLTMNNEVLRIVATGMSGIKAFIESTESPNDFDASNKGTIFTGFRFELPAGASQTVSVKLIP